MLFWALLLFLGLVSFDANDPSFNLVKTGGEVNNKAGLFGAYAAGFLNDIFGIGALLWPPVFAALGVAYISSSLSMNWWRWCGIFLLTLCFLMAASSLDLSIGDLSGGGMVGNTLYYKGKRYLSPFGSLLTWLFILLCALQLAFNISWISLGQRWYGWLLNKIRARGQKAQEDGARGSHTFAAFGERAVSVFNGIKNNLRKIGQGGAKKEAMPDIDLEPAPKQPLLEVPQPVAASLAKTDDDDPFAVCEDLRDPAGAVEWRIEPQSAPAPKIVELMPPQAAEAQASPEAVELPEIMPQPEIIYTGQKAISSIVPETGQERVDMSPGLPSQARREQGLLSTCGIVGNKNMEPVGEAPLPPLDLLKPPTTENATPRAELEQKGRALMACFKDFDIQGELARITPGPVVTMFEMRPASGTRVSKIANLSDDLSMAMKAVAVRIQAPIPGTDTVGIEIPNENRETVNFRELCASEEFMTTGSPLTMILGKTIAGKPYMADLARMPHLLVAGATGAGKSVCLNGILISLLYHNQPDQMQLLLIDPKRIEMAAYADLPHLVHPVVTEMSDAKNALEWAVNEMENRYKAMARLGVRNVAAYNRKLANVKDDLPPDFGDLRPLPYLVIVIDELADLMMTAAREVETSIVRLAQLARAAGIHMILATQRPSVDVVTGIIKANFPSRISFQVTSKHDSRTILDQNGAEHLLGRGDMLYKPSGGILQRLHGPFLSDEEVLAVVGHWKKYLAPSYKVDFSQWSGDNNANSAGPGGDATADALYADARAFVMSQEKVSISLMQRYLKIGFNRAARLMDQFEREGLLGPAVGSSPRNVIR